MSQKILSGDCMCGAVSVSFPVERDVFAACHCGMCRKWGGGPALTVEGNKNVTMKGEEFITVYSSSESAERGFCKCCGTHLFYRLKNESFYSYPLGLLNEADRLKFSMQIFIDRKPENYSFQNQTELMTEAQVFAKYT